ncbi:hypothetical protein MVEN_02225500 [Mycena venus]|uniref:Uncharacterized protein n=1 Tax=Mycena venus TaxID=2733690 RepID=A0A8H6X701_9AGAR|nr:hypothetical protein MVEN_02225500 [Mycena venus]
MTGTEPSTSHLTTEAVASTSTSAPTAAQTERAPAAEEHKKHGLGAVIDKIVHPHGHGGDHHKDKEQKEDAPSVPVAVPAEPSDGPAHLAPGGSGFGGIL